MVASVKALGGWEEDRAQLASAPVTGIGLYADQPAFLDFKVLTLQLMTNLAKDKSFDANDGPVYFVLADGDLFGAVRSLATSVALLRIRPINYFGRLWFVPRNLGHGFAIETGAKPPDDVFEQICNLGGGERPCIVVDPYKPELAMVYADGVSRPEAGETVDLSDMTVNAASIDEALDGLYSLIRSPDQSTERPLWHVARKWQPVKEAEKAVQHEVTRALAGRFGRFLDVRSEQPSSIGRTDLELIQFRGLPFGQNIRHALIELKVLRSFGSTGKEVSDRLIRRHISQGVRQASSYGDASNSKIRMLCCYDMRKADNSETLKDFEQPAKERNVLLRRYFLHNSSETLRQALDEVKVANGATPFPE